MTNAGAAGILPAKMVDLVFTSEERPLYDLVSWERGNSGCHIVVILLHCFFIMWPFDIVPLDAKPALAARPHDEIF